MKQILRYLKPYLGKLLAATVLIALSTLCDLLLPTWMSAILNGGIAARDFPAIAVRCLQMLAIAAVSLASILGGTRLSTEVVACFCADLRADVFRKVNTLSFEEFGSLGTAALVTRATHDVDTVSWVASMLSGTVATIPMLFLGGVVLAMRKDVVLSLVLLAFVPLLTLIVVLLGKRVLPLWGKSDDYIDVQNALLRELLERYPDTMVFDTVYGTFARLYRVSAAAAAGLAPDDIASALGMKPYAVKKNLTLSRRVPPAALRRALRERRGRGATILISQRLHTIRGADQILVLDDGAVCGLGDHDTLYATCPAYREICQTQLETEEAGA